MRDRELAGMNLEKLYGVRGHLERSDDPCAGAALRLVETEIRLRRRMIAASASIVVIPSRNAAAVQQ
jgi:hypothetical protein